MLQGGSVCPSPIMSRGPERTLLPGIGVASAVLAGVIVAFAFRATLVGFSLTSGDRASGPPKVLRVQGRSEPVRLARAKRTRAARRAPVSAPRRPARAPAHRSATAVRADRAASTPPLPPPP